MEFYCMLLSSRYVSIDSNSILRVVHLFLIGGFRIESLINKEKGEGKGRMYRFEEAGGCNFVEYAK